MTHTHTVHHSQAEPFKIGTMQGTAATSSNSNRGTVSGGFGNTTAYTEPYWYSGTMKSPYYNDSHIAFRKLVRDFVQTELEPHVNQWEETGTYPMELHEKAYKAGVLGSNWPSEYGGTPPKGFDAFHDLILFDELVSGDGITSLHGITTCVGVWVYNSVCGCVGVWHVPSDTLSHAHTHTRARASHRPVAPAVASSWLYFSRSASHCPPS